MSNQIEISIVRSQRLISAAKTLLDLIEDDGQFLCDKREPFVLLCALSIEAILNEALSDLKYLLQEQDLGKSLINAFATMGLQAKLNSLFYILSKGRYTINKSSECYTYLRKIIKARNISAHPKPIEVGSFEIDMYKNTDGFDSFLLPKEVFTKRLLQSDIFTAQELKNCLLNVLLLQNTLKYIVREDTLENTDLLMEVS